MFYTIARVMAVMYLNQFAAGQVNRGCQYSKGGVGMPHVLCCFICFNFVLEALIMHAAYHEYAITFTAKQRAQV